MLYCCVEAPQCIRGVIRTILLFNVLAKKSSFYAVSVYFEIYLQILERKFG
jgi:hypothetical protein